jgi:outer membrane receptor protein involved in Fe transport
MYIVWSVALIVAAGDEAAPRDITEFSLEDLLNIETGVATRTSTRLRESPAIVTIISRDEIINMGARDLIDVLNLVPGFHFGVDVQSVVGLGVRGNWAHEGKVLLLIDGQVMNEGLFLTLQFGNHYPIDNIEKIEIIRGPGSVIYGGYAELAVINVITRNGAAIDGARVSGVYGRGMRTMLRQSVSLAAGTKLENGLDLALSGTIGRGNRGDYVYRDIYGTSYRLRDGDADTDPKFLDVGVSWEGLQLRLIYDGYHTTQRDAFDASMSRHAPQGFKGWYGELSYPVALGDLTITPKVTAKRQKPWFNHVADPEFQDAGIYYPKQVDRFTGGLTVGHHDLVEGLELLGGVEAYLEQARVFDAEFEPQLFAGDDEVEYQNLAGFAQAVFSHPIVNVSAGARYESHDQYGSSFVPRLGLTKVIDRFHAKLLYSQAFKAPGVENIRLNAGVQPERTQVVEAEVGYQLTDEMFAALNVFDITIDDPIIYTITESAEGYTNEETTGTRGLELEYRVRMSRGYATLGYSFYTAAGKDQPANYAVLRDSSCTDPECRRTDALLLGFPAHKLVLSASAQLLEGLTINPSVVAMSERYSYASVDELGEVASTEAEPATMLLNLYLRYTPGIAGVSVGAGVFNALGEKFKYLQPYDGWHAPFPASGREIVVRLEIDQAI